MNAYCYTDLIEDGLTIQVDVIIEQSALNEVVRYTCSSHDTLDSRFFQEKRGPELKNSNHYIAKNFVFSETKFCNINSYTA